MSLFFFHLVCGYFFLLPSTFVKTYTHTNTGNVWSVCQDKNVCSIFLMRKLSNNGATDRTMCKCNWIQTEAIPAIGLSVFARVLIARNEWAANEKVEKEREKKQRQSQSQHNSLNYFFIYTSVYHFGWRCFLHLLFCHSFEQCSAQSRWLRAWMNCFFFSLFIQIVPSSIELLCLCVCVLWRLL